MNQQLMTCVFILFNLCNQGIKSGILAIALEYIINMVTIKSWLPITKVIIWQRIIILPVMLNGLRRELLIGFQIFLYLGWCGRTLCKS